MKKIHASVSRSENCGHAPGRKHAATVYCASLIALSLCAALFTGCASRIIDAATTKLEIHQGKNKGAAFTFPKELDAKGFKFSIDPKTGVIKLDADSIATSSQGVIDRAGAAQAQAMADLSKTVGALTSAVLPLLAPQAALLRTVPIPRAPEDTPAAEPVPPVPEKPPAPVLSPEALFVPVDPALISVTAK